MKKCPSCQTEKLAADYYRDKHSKSGLFAYCIDCVRTKKKSYDVKCREKALAVLGGKCVECGFTDIRALQIDHINGGGTKEYKEVGGNRAVYVKISKGEQLEKYQLLCANCNWIKRSENREYGNYFKEGRRSQSRAQA